VIPAQYEYAQITFQPVIDLEEDNRIKASLRESKNVLKMVRALQQWRFIFRTRGRSQKMAELSGIQARAELDPAYAAVAFNLKDPTGFQMW
jgi:peptidyl-prolyl cis-trans isomerase SurA